MQPQETPERSAEALAARLRALAPPPVPADLEARLLADIPCLLPVREKTRSWVAWTGMAGALAAACLLVALAWHWERSSDPEPNPPPERLRTQIDPEPPPWSAWAERERDPEELESATFTWPLPESLSFTASPAIPADLLD